MKTLSYGFEWLRLAFVLLLMGMAGHAMAAKTYTDNGDGTVTDPTTGLVWMRCAMGQTWDGKTCVGTAGIYTFMQGNAAAHDPGNITFAGRSDWRLPNIRELQTIVDRSASNPAIDSVAFPGTAPSDFLSASAEGQYWSVFVWYVNFSVGFSSKRYYLASDTYQVRLVRGEPSANLVGTARPISSYTDNGDGTVTHTPTGLMWQRCALGQTLSAEHCTGIAGTYTWGQAKLASSSLGGHTDWRLPTEDELISLMDYDATPNFPNEVFPDTPKLNFWSASAVVGDTKSAWYANFYNDGSAYFGNKSDPGPVRLVRAGKFFDPSVTTTASATSTTTSTVATTTTTTQVATIPDQSPARMHMLPVGWNLLGNGWNQPLSVASVFGDAASVTTVWKWDVAKTGWQFYSPSMTAQDLQNYAASNGFGVLGTVGAGEGYWVHLKQPFIVTLPKGDSVLGADFQPGGTRALATGWNLIAIGESLKVNEFNNMLSITPPVAGAVPQNLTSLWAWDNSKSQWYFYSPKLDASGITVLTDYIASKGYLDFTAANKLLDAGTGFWVNKP